MQVCQACALCPVHGIHHMRQAVLPILGDDERNRSHLRELAANGSCFSKRASSCTSFAQTPHAAQTYRSTLRAPRMPPRPQCHASGSVHNLPRVFPIVQLAPNRFCRICVLPPLPLCRGFPMSGVPCCSGPSTPGEHGLGSAPPARIASKTPDQANGCHTGGPKFGVPPSSGCATMAPCLAHVAPN